MSSDGPTITSLELEDRRFPPPAEFAAQANATEELYERAGGDPEAFWLAQTKELLTWETEPTQGVDRSNPPFFTWFADGTLNASVQCLDRHLESKGDHVAFFWEGEPADERMEVTYRDLHERVCRLSNGLRELGVGKGDRVAIYMRHDPGGRRRDARLRPHRRAAHGGLRRFLRRLAARPREGLRRQRDDHRATAAGAAASWCR